MLRRLILSVVAAATIALITLGTWKALEEHQTSQVARLAEIESYAVRSQIIRNMDSMFHGLRDLHEYWSNYQDLPPAEWPPDTPGEIAGLSGVRSLLWIDGEGRLRFATSGDDEGLHRRPTGEDLAEYEPLLGRAARVTAGTVLGPFFDEAGNVTIEICVLSSRRDRPGKLVAVVDTGRAFSEMLLNESPGYAMFVYWDDVLLYRRGQPAADLPASWTQENTIRPLTGEPWRIVHTPTETLAASLRTPALPGLLGSGLAIALLVGLLLFENGRARSRAAAAEIAEHKLAELNRDLERQIADRVKELADRSTDLETITDSVAHDLRNPLNSISVNTQLLQQQFADDLGDDGLEALKRTAAGVRRMTEILDRLLGLSVVSHATFQPEEVDMAALVADVFEELNAPEQPPPVELTVKDLPNAYADPTLVRTLVTNLLGNAIKYTRDKPVRLIEVSARTDRGTAVYCIRDNGIGFDPEARERMFRAFERLDTGDGAEGIGLGLDIAARVVKRHGGRIWANGNVGDGAAFYFTLAPACLEASGTLLQNRKAS